MTKRSLLAQLYAARQRAKAEQQRAEERARQEYAAESRRLQAQLDKEAEQERRAEERAAQARAKDREQKARTRQQAALAAERAEVQRQREHGRQAAAKLRGEQSRQADEKREAQRRAAEEQRLAVQRRQSEADIRTEALVARIAGLERLLRDRNRHPATASRHAEEVFNREGPDAFVSALQQALATSVYPDRLHGSCAAMYRPEARELLVEYELPRQDVIPDVTAYRYVKSRDVLQPEPRKQTEIRKRYGDLIARVTLRTLADAFAIAPVTLVGAIVFNGYVSAKDRATGKPIRPLLVSTHATRDAFEEIVLDEPELDPVACLRAYLNAIVSPHPYDLEAVRPVLQFDLSKYKFIDEMDVVAGLDSRPDLLELTPGQFEQLIRQLFEAIGLKSWVTQTSRDDGIDGVAVNEDPIVGGLCVIQAKRYSTHVEVEAVRALAGVMDDLCAAKGVLVTTAWVGKASRDFAARNGRIEIIEGRHLKSLLREHLGLDVLIGLPRVPPGWEPGDVS